MIYWKVNLFYDMVQDPIEVWTELTDDLQEETRKVEIFASGAIAFASKDEEHNTLLSVPGEIPPLSEINKDPQLEGVEISKEEFEEIWNSRIQN